MIEGLQALEGPISQVNEGQLPLPPEFDKTKYSGKWVVEGPQVQKAQQKEVISSARVAADGWAIWHDANKKPHKRSLGKMSCILMFRPKKLQEAVNKLHGNTSRMRLSDEVLGATVAGTDSRAADGLISSAELEARGLKREVEEGQAPPLNHVDLRAAVQAETSPA